MVRFQPKSGGEVEAKQDGQLRLGQVVTTFGPGAMVDLLDHAVLVSGLDYWAYSKYTPPRLIKHERLREHIVEQYRLNLSPDEPFRAPPIGKDDAPTKWSGIPALEFPGWFVCQGCSALLSAAHMTEPNAHGHREHHCDGRKRASRCVPVRFVGACRRGHLQDYEWRYFAHEHGACAGGQLTLEEGNVGDFGQIRVKCACGQMRRLSDAMQKALRPRCRGQRPWLGRDGQEECEEDLHLLVRTASNGYFPQVLSALAIPDPATELHDGVMGALKAIGRVESVDELRLLRRLQPETLEAVAGFSDEEVLAAIATIREGKKVERAPLRDAEYQSFVDSPRELPIEETKDDFIAQNVTVPKRLSNRVGSIVLAHKLREVRAQIGFTRLEPATQDAKGEFDLEVELSKITLDRTWLPANELWGEGVFLALNEEAVAEWESRKAVIARRDELFAGHKVWAKQLMARSDNKLKKEPPFLSVRFYLLHSLSHLLMTAISMECGYAASAIRERIYCGPTEDDDTPMAAILLATGTSGSEGTLGGLVDQGRRIEHHLKRALVMGELCSNDPVCARHSPAQDPGEQFLQGAACHGCLFIAECSCERFNRYLDRALVVPTMGHDPELAFFGGKG